MSGGLSRFSTLRCFGRLGVVRATSLQIAYKVSGTDQRLSPWFLWPGAGAAQLLQRGEQRALVVALDGLLRRASEG